MKKHDIVSIFQSHDPIKVDDILERILSFVPKRPGRILFRYEPAIVHVGCRTLELAKRFYLLAREAGFFRPGILTIDNPLVEVVGNDKMEAPIADLDGMKVKDDYIRFLVDCANERMVQNQQRLKVFRNILEEKL